jgi:hypothetical protein
MKTIGIPPPGSYWNFDADEDLWAFAYPSLTVIPKTSKKGDPTQIWYVDQKYSTKPLQSEQDEIENPLLTPQKVSGSFVKYSKEAVKDRFNADIVSSSHEPFTGPLVTFDESRPTVQVIQNVADQELALISNQINTVNDATLWGLAPRKVKLSEVSWTKQFHVSGDVYYTRTFGFDINFDTFDTTFPDRGTKVVNGEWNPITRLCDKDPEADHTNPSDFDVYQDKRGNTPDTVLLNGFGEPVNTDLAPGTGTDNSLVYLTIEYYPESNFLLLGIPTSL